MAGSHIIHTHPKTGELKPFAPPHAILQTSGFGSGWRGFTFEHHRLPALETSEFLVTKQIIALQISPPLQVEWKERGHYRGRQFLPGEASLTPAYTWDALRWPGEANEFLVCELDTAFMAQSVREIVKSEKIELRQIRGIQDARIDAILSGLKADVDAGYSSGAIFGEMLATALAVHLVQTYCVTPTTPVPAHAISRAELHRALDYIHDHLASDLSLSKIADAAGYSPSHFSRLFRKATGQSPHRYVITARIERARHLLRQRDASVSAVSAQLGFYDESHFIRHFKQATGFTPGEWAGTSRNVQ